MAKLRAAECREFIKAAIEKADEMGVPVSIAVVGPEGHLIRGRAHGRCRLHHPGHRDRQSLYRGGLPLHEPTLPRWAR